MKLSPSSPTLLPSSAHQGPPTVFAMLANLVAMFAFPFPPPLPALVMCFSYYIVISGHHLSLVSLATNTILLLLMIIRIIYGHSLCDSNLTLFLHCQIFSPMSTHSLASLSRGCKVIMVASSTISTPARSLRLMAFSFACHALTLSHKMVKPNVSFVPPITPFAPYYFTRVFHQLFGLLL
jgi:hypothetical protein